MIQYSSKAQGKNYGWVPLNYIESPSNNITNNNISFSMYINYTPFSELIQCTLHFFFFWGYLILLENMLHNT